MLLLGALISRPCIPGLCGWPYPHLPWCPFTELPPGASRCLLHALLVGFKIVLPCSVACLVACRICQVSSGFLGVVELHLAAFLRGPFAHSSAVGFAQHPGGMSM